MNGVHLGRLVVVELRRLAARRMVWGIALGGVAVVALILWGTSSMVRPLTAAQLDEAERYYLQAMADWEENGEQYVADCLEAQEAEQELNPDAAIDFGCLDQEPRREWYVTEPAALADTLPSTMASALSLTAFLALLIGATATAAELSTGSITTWLTFVPRRLRVYSSKLLAVGVGLVPVLTALTALLALGVWAVHAAFGAPTGLTAGQGSEVVWICVRLIVVSLTLGVIGAALGILLRHTAAVLGVVVGYAIVVEAMLAGALPWLQPWTVLINLRAVVEGGATYGTYECTTGAGGSSCEYLEHTLGQGQGSAYLLGLTVLVVLLGAVVFRRRDVA